MNKVLVTGGAGFIGVNLASALLEKGYKVNVFDNLSRKGAKVNLDFLKKRYSSKLLEITVADVRDFRCIQDTVNVDCVFHLAAQTAVTTSVIDPRNDFEINVQGTFNILEAIRKQKSGTALIYSSTNKVYGSLEYLKYKTTKNHYEFKDFPNGIDEATPLDFHSPYGVSKGSAESYVRDYFRIYGIPTVTFRQSCIYGERQFGVEDQGWIAHLAAMAVKGREINIFGDGRQVRDLLYVGDLIEAYLKAVKEIKKVKGEVFNIGGGSKNTLSVLEYVDYLEKYLGKKIKRETKKTRPGDQKVFVSDNSKLKKTLNWEVSTPFTLGVPKMINWIKENNKYF